MAQHSPNVQFNEIPHINHRLDLAIGQTVEKRDFSPHLIDILHPDLHSLSPTVIALPFPWRTECLKNLLAENAYGPFESHQGQPPIAAGHCIFGAGLDEC